MASAGMSARQAFGGQPAEVKKSETQRVDAYGDPLPPGAIARLGTARWRHGYPVHTAVFSPDGKIVASTSSGKGLCLWEAETGKRILQVWPGYVFDAVAFSPDGQVFATAGHGLRVWRTATGRRIPFPKGEVRGLTKAVAFSPDGKTLVSGEQDKSIRLWDLATGEETKKLDGHTNWVVSLSFSRDGKLLASAGLEDVLRVWDMETGRQLRAVGVRENPVLSIQIL